MYSNKFLKGRALKNYKAVYNKFFEFSKQAKMFKF